MNIAELAHSIEANDIDLTDLNKNLFLQLQKVMRENDKLRVENKKLRENIRIDPLTQLYNRQFMEEYLKDEIDRSERYNTSFSMLIIDIDYFKDVNDLYGHQAGDSVLRRVSEILIAELRTCDLVFRYGGEEFLIALPETTLAGAYSTATKLRKRIEHEYMEAIKKNITISVGVSQRKKEETMEHLIYSVDMALYEAKKNGRNQVRIAA